MLPAPDPHKIRRIVIREIVITAGSGRRPLAELRELLGCRDLLYVLARRDIAARYRQSALGVLWAVLQPLGTMAIFSIVFGRLIGVSSGNVPYPLFAFAGLLPWQFFASSINAAGTSVINTPNLITKVYFPRLVIPLAALGAPLLDFAVSSVLLLLLAAHYGVWPSLRVLAMPAFLLLAAVAALGVGSFVAAMAVSYRDFRHLLPFMTQSWMFLTPVIYPPRLIPQSLQPLLYLNPMTGVVEGMRWAWLGGELQVQQLALSGAVAVLLCVFGVGYFRAVERRFADLV